MHNCLSLKFNRKHFDDIIHLICSILIIVIGSVFFNCKVTKFLQYQNKQSNQNLGILTIFSISEAT